MKLYIAAHRRRRLDKRGFTLVELMVSMGLFITVLAIAMGSLLMVIDTNRKARTMSAAMDNLSLAMEEMSRTLRQGRTYHCDVTVTTPALTEARPCIDGASSMAFESYYGSTTISIDQVHYKLATTTTTGVIQKSLDNGATYFDVTPPSIVINQLDFYVKGPTPAELAPYAHSRQHPRITIVVKGVTGANKPQYETEFSFQTTITQRSPEVE